MTRPLLLLGLIFLAGSAFAEGESCFTEPGWRPTRKFAPELTEAWIGIPKPIRIGFKESVCVRVTDPKDGKIKHWQIACGVRGVYVLQELASDPGSRTFEKYCPIVLHGSMIRCPGPCPATPTKSPIPWGSRIGQGSGPADPKPPDPSQGRVLFVSVGADGRGDQGEVGPPVRVLVDGRTPVQAIPRASTTVAGPDKRCEPASRVTVLAPGAHFYTVPGDRQAREFTVQAGECKVIRIGIMPTWGVR